jgi:HNH endonuclease
VSDAFRYGRRYWCVGVEKTVSRSGQLFANACRVEIKPDGALELWSDSAISEGGELEARDAPFPVLAFARGMWRYYFAASCFDGHAVAVEHWPGEVDDGEPKPTGRAAVRTTPDEKRAERNRMDQAYRYRVMKRDGFVCAACNRNPSEHGVVLEVDHVLPVALGGKTTDENLQTLCRDCNRSKAAQHPDEGFA